MVNIAVMVNSEPNLTKFRANQGKFVAEDLRKSIMKRSRLRNKFLRDRTKLYRKEY